MCVVNLSAKDLPQIIHSRLAAGAFQEACMASCCSPCSAALVYPTPDKLTKTAHHGGSPSPYPGTTLSHLGRHSRAVIAIQKIELPLQGAGESILLCARGFDLLGSLPKSKCPRHTKATSHPIPCICAIPTSLVSFPGEEREQRESNRCVCPNTLSFSGVDCPPMPRPHSGGHEALGTTVSVAKHVPRRLQQQHRQQSTEAHDERSSWTVRLHPCIKTHGLVRVSGHGCNSKAKTRRPPTLLAIGSKRPFSCNNSAVKGRRLSEHVV